MTLVSAWTGRTACALQASLRLSNESFAEHLGVSVRTVAAWHQKPTLRPKSEMQQLLDTALEQSSAAVKARFAQVVPAPASAVVGHPTAMPEDVEHARAVAEAEQRLGSNPHVGVALEWLDRYAGWQPGTGRRKVASRLAALDARALQDRGSRRGRVDQRQVAQALADYYRGGSDSPDHGRYGVNYGNSRKAVTSVLTRATWLDLACPLASASDLHRTVVDAAGRHLRPHCASDPRACSRAPCKVTQPAASIAGIRKVRSRVSAVVAPCPRVSRKQSSRWVLHYCPSRPPGEGGPPA